MNFKMETTTVWDFPERGSWATHKGDYPGNWSPYIPKNIILRYSKEGDMVLDQFSGSGTTLIEAKLLKRNAIGCDINDNAILISKKRLECFKSDNTIKIIKADAQNLKFLKDNSIDLICTHPPYSNIIKYSKYNKSDISLLDDDDFLYAIRNVAKECFRVLKNGRFCAILMGDKRKHGFIIPLGFNVMNSFLKCGFKLKEIIIKKQHNCRSTEKWKEISINRNFYLIAHEYLFVFKK